MCGKGGKVMYHIKGELYYLVLTAHIWTTLYSGQNKTNTVERACLLSPSNWPHFRKLARMKEQDRVFRYFQNPHNGLHDNALASSKHMDKGQQDGSVSKVLATQA